ncbi:hypothetical protein F4775DRAFT_573921 [Biscogniauxia sp. FL1348]|nr:hypothetical protein F4775DRAFT_573921 [Biscogniauxia sp. FL1348]
MSAAISAEMSAQPQKILLQDHYLPEIIKHFDSQGIPLPHESCSIDCAICREPLAVFQPADEDHHRWTCLPCGHVFGYNCIRTWFRTSESGPACPSCRQSMVHPFCHHPTHFKALHLKPGFNIHKAMPTSNKLSPLCRGCGPKNPHLNPQRHPMPQGDIRRADWLTSPWLAFDQNTPEPLRPSMQARRDASPGSPIGGGQSPRRYLAPMSFGPYTDAPDAPDTRGQPSPEYLAPYPMWRDIGSVYHHAYHNYPHQEPLVIHPLIAQATQAAQARATSFSQSQQTPAPGGQAEGRQESAQARYEENGIEFDSETQPDSSAEEPGSPKIDEAADPNHGDAQEPRRGRLAQYQVQMPENPYRQDPQQVQHPNHHPQSSGQIRRLASARLTVQLARRAQAQMHMRESGRAGQPTPQAGPSLSAPIPLPIFPDPPYQNPQFGPPL